MHDGWLKVLTLAGYEVRHSHSDKSTFSHSNSIATTVMKDGVDVLKIEQNFDGKGGHSLAEIYRYAAIKLKLIEPNERCPETPVDLVIEKTTKGPHTDTTFKHPSFGSIVINRYSGGGKHFMSPVNTMGGISIEIFESELVLNNDLGTEHIFPHRPLLRLNMSFTQFAEAITSHGVGAGVPCTLSYAEGCPINPCELDSPEERLEEVARESMNEAVAEITTLIQELDPEMNANGSLSSPRKKEIWHRITNSLSGISTKPQWLLRVWRELDAKKMAHAKSEFAHWATSWTGKHHELQERIHGPLALENKEKK